jgi:hypothetical protein
MLTAIAIAVAFLVGYALAHRSHIRGLPDALAAARAPLEAGLREALTVEPREQQARALARKAIAECPFYALSRLDHDATADWMQQQHMQSGAHTFLRVCTTLEGLRELATSQPRHAGDAIVFPVFLARELLGLPRFDGTEQPAVEPVHQFMVAVPPGAAPEQQALAPVPARDPVPFPKPPVRHE